MQPCDDVVPVDETYVPAEQLVHVAAAASEYVPAGHETQADDDVAATSGELVPAAQLVHASAPDVLYVPAIQLIQLLDEAWPVSEL
jgi:hypothetical protein